jgi:hypothetical protein
VEFATETLRAQRKFGIAAFGAALWVFFVQGRGLTLFHFVLVCFILFGFVLADEFGHLGLFGCDFGEETQF